MFDQEYEGDSDEDDDIAANLFLTFMALRELLPELYKWFGVGEPEYANGEDGDGSEEGAGFDVDDFNDRDSGDFDHDRMNEEFDEQEDASAPEDAVTEGYD
jgi:hypothetical protein